MEDVVAGSLPIDWSSSGNVSSCRYYGRWNSGISSLGGRWGPSGGGATATTFRDSPTFPLSATLAAPVTFGYATTIVAQGIDVIDDLVFLAAAGPSTANTTAWQFGSTVGAWINHSVLVPGSTTTDALVLLIYWAAHSDWRSKIGEYDLRFDAVCWMLWMVWVLSVLFWTKPWWTSVRLMYSLYCISSDMIPCSYT